MIIKNLYQGHKIQWWILSMAQHTDFLKFHKKPIIFFLPIEFSLKNVSKNFHLCHRDPWLNFSFPFFWQWLSFTFSLNSFIYWENLIILGSHIHFEHSQQKNSIFFFFWFIINWFFMDQWLLHAKLLIFTRCVFVLHFH